MSDYPMMLYRAGSAFSWDGKDTDSLIVADGDAHDEAAKDGWQTAADYLAVETSTPSLLDGSAKEIEPALAALDLAALETLKADEQAGKTRKSVIALIDAAIDAKLA